MALIDELARQVTRVRVESAYLPPIEIADPFQPGEPNPYLARLKPKITLEIAHGAIRPLVMAPYGEPGPSRWPQVRAALAIGAGALAGLVLLQIARRW